MALTVNKSRAVTGGNQGSRAPLKASNVPFIGSLLSRNSSGFVNALAAGEPFAGISVRRVEAGDWKSSGAADGDLFADYISGRGFLIVALTVTQADAQKRRKVFASDDDTFTFTAVGNTLIGEVVEIISTSQCVVEFTTGEEIDAGPGSHGVETLPDAPTTLTVKQLNKVLRAPVTVARTYTLPPAADCIGKYITIVAEGAFVVTAQGNAAENIGGANTLALTNTVGRSMVLYCTGVASFEWEIISKQ